MLRVRQRSSLPVLEQVEKRTYVPSKGPVTNQYGQTYWYPCWPPKLASTTLTTQSLGPSDADNLRSSEKIVDEVNDRVKVKKDAIKYVRHVKSDIDQVSVFDGAYKSSLNSVPVVASMYMGGVPRAYYADLRTRTWLPSLHALARAKQFALVKRQGDDLVLSATLGSMPADRLPEVPARLVKKLDDLHLLNSAWEARELPDLRQLFDKRNRLATKAGIDWLAGRMPRFGSVYDYCRQYNPMDKRGFLARPVLDYLRKNQLGYSFGLMPTIGEIRAIAAAMKGGLKARNYRTSATIIQSSSVTKNSTLEGLPDPVYSASMREDVLIRRVDGMRATLRRRRYYSDFLESVLPALVGHNPMGSVWAAMPFSWCVDLFLSIDDVLDTLWCLKQTEYEIECWSSTKVLSSQAFNFEVLEDMKGFYPSTPDMILRGGQTMIQKVSLYERLPRSLPTPLSSVRARVGPMMGYLTALVALGFLPHGKTK